MYTIIKARDSSPKNSKYVLYYLQSHFSIQIIVVQAARFKDTD